MAENAQGKYVTLVSNDGFEFVVIRDAAMKSTMIKKMIEPRSGFQEALTGVCRFQDINGAVLEKVVEYFHYWYRYKDSASVPDMDIPVEICLELLVAADFLGLDNITS